MDALLGTLRDPSYMMQWFESSRATLSPIVELVRRPEVKLHDTLTKLCESVHDVTIIKGHANLVEMLNPTSVDSAL